MVSGDDSVVQRDDQVVSGDDSVVKRDDQVVSGDDSVVKRWGTRRCDGECAGGKAEVVKDGADGARGSDVGQDAPVAAALVAGQDVEREGAAKQLGSGKPVLPGRRGRSGRGRGLREARRWD